MHTLANAIKQLMSKPAHFMLVAGSFLLLGCAQPSAAFEARARSNASSEQISVVTTEAQVSDGEAAEPTPAPTPTPVFVPLATPSPDLAPPDGIDASAEISGVDSRTQQQLIGSVGNVQLGELIIQLGALHFVHETRYLDGPDQEDYFLRFGIAFDRAHTLEAWDFRIIDHRGEDFLADFGQDIPQGAASVRFTLESGMTVATTSGWVLQISDGSDMIEVDL